MWLPGTPPALGRLVPPPPTSSSQLGLASSSTRGQIVSSELLSTRTQVATVCLLLRVWAEALVPTSQPGGQSGGWGGHRPVPAIWEDICQQS